MSPSKNILILMSGSIACYKVCILVSQLKQKNYAVKVVMSEAAQKFVGTATIEGLLGEAPITDMYASGSIMEHIHLARWADLVLLAPATANTINKMAAGLGDDLLTTLFLAHDFQKPFLVTPAMNTKMYQHSVTQKSLAVLKAMGVVILETASGVLACGEIGYGRLLEPDLILNEIEANLQKEKKAHREQAVTPLPRKKVLITSGGTQEPIDDVRMITNKSTGRTAASICDQFILSGFEVTYLHAQNAQSPRLDCQKICFTTFSDLDQKLNAALSVNQYDLIIHAAAVSDYSVDKTFDGKMNSKAETLTLHLKKNPKLIQKIKSISPNTKLVGFKLTSSTDPNEIREKVAELFQSAKCDFVVQNDWQSVQTGQTTFALYDLNTIKKNLDIESLSIELVQIILKKDVV